MFKAGKLTLVVLIVVVVLIAVLSGCDTGEENGPVNGDSGEAVTEITDQELDPAETGIQEGFVIEIDESRILVVSDISQEKAFTINAENLLEGNIGTDAVWYKVSDTGVYEVGQLLRVKSEMMMESYPGQSEAILVQIVEEP